MGTQLTRLTYHPVRPHALGHTLNPGFDYIVHLGSVGLLIECSDEHKIKWKMSAGRRPVTVVHQCLVERRIAFDHHEQSIKKTSGNGFKNKKTSRNFNKRRAIVPNICLFFCFLKKEKIFVFYTQCTCELLLLFFFLRIYEGNKLRNSVFFSSKPTFNLSNNPKKRVMGRKKKQPTIPQTLWRGYSSLVNMPLIVLPYYYNLQ